MNNKEMVLKTFEKVSLEYLGNSNSIHELGNKSKKLEEAASSTISKLLKLDDQEIIYTSGLLESLNLLFFGYLEKFANNVGKEVKVLIDERIDKDLKEALKDLNIAITFFDIASFNEEWLKDQDLVLVYFDTVPMYLENLIQNKQERLKIAINISRNLDCLNLKNIDFILFDLQKIDGILGIGALIRKKNLELTPLLHGGKSTTNARSGTPALALIVSFAKNLHLWYNDQKMKHTTNG